MTDTKLKDPDSTVVFQIDWSDWLGTATINTSDWVVDPVGEMVINSNNIDSTQKFTSVNVSAGIKGSVYRLTNTILASTGETPDRTITVRVGDR